MKTCEGQRLAQATTYCLRRLAESESKHMVCCILKTQPHRILLFYMMPLEPAELFTTVKVRDSGPASAHFLALLTHFGAEHRSRSRQHFDQTTEHEGGKTDAWYEATGKLSYALHQAHYKRRNPSRCIPTSYLRSRSYQLPLIRRQPSLRDAYMFSWKKLSRMP